MSSVSAQYAGVELGRCAPGSNARCACVVRRCLGNVRSLTAGLDLAGALPCVANLRQWRRFNASPTERKVSTS